MIVIAKYQDNEGDGDAESTDQENILEDEILLPSHTSSKIAEKVSSSLEPLWSNNANHCQLSSFSVVKRR